MEQTDKRIALEAERERLVAFRDRCYDAMFVHDNPSQAQSEIWYKHYCEHISRIELQLSQIKEEEKR